MAERAELQEFVDGVAALRRHRLLKPLFKRDKIALGELELADIAELLKHDAGYYFLIAAAELNRSSLKQKMQDPEAKIVQKELRRAYVVKQHLPSIGAFEGLSERAKALREGDLQRKSRGGIEGLFRDRLKAEGIPVLMSPPVRQVPGLLVRKRKPDGVYPDPASGRAPRVYLEIKNVRRVSDDIQKRLYEVAEVSLEMKFLYGQLSIAGLGLENTKDVIENPEKLRAKLRSAILEASPKVVVLLLCSASQANSYREGAEAFIDRVFFQEEIDECLQYLKLACNS